MEEIISRAVAQEKNYNWLKTGDLYEQALDAVGEEDFLKRGEIQEKIGYCLQRAAFQAESQEEFKERMQRALEAYKKAQGFYERLTDEQGAAWMFRCRALAKYISQWSTPDPSEKRELLDECLELEEKALKAFWDRGDKLEYGRTYNELRMVSLDRADLELDTNVRKGILEKGVSWGEKAVAAPTVIRDAYEIVRAQQTLARYLVEARDFNVIEKQRQIRSRLSDYLRKVAEFSERVGDDYLAGLSHIVLSFFGPFREARRNSEKAVEFCEKTRDNLLMAQALDWASYDTYWIAIGTEDPDQRRRLADEAMEFYDRAHHHYSLISYQIPRGGKLGALPPGGYAEYYLDRAGWEIDLGKKLEFLEKSEKAGLKALEMAENLDIPNFISRMSHILSRTLAARARLETDVDMKRSLLEKALEYRERNIEIYERIEPFNHWNIGVFRNFLADIKAELANIQPDLDTRRRLLEDAVSNKEKSLNILYKRLPYMHTENLSVLQMYQDGYGIILTHLYEAIKAPEYLRKAIDIWRKAIETASKAELVSRVAESYWKIAKAQITIGEQTKAAESFEHASESYKKAAEKIPQLKDFYQEHASYMQSWSEFERAKQRHAEKRYLIAKEHYEKAAELHKSTGRWSYLAPNYLAWARLEEAEDLSRSEETEEARDLFQQAANLFVEAKESIKTNLDTIEAGEERQIAEDLIKASDVRREYCFGRTALEEARILDRQGDHGASSRKYSSATKRFQKVIDTMERESERKELRPIVFLCQAWEKMMMAEARDSPNLYGEAAELFIEAKDHALDQTTSFLAQGHSSFCRALEAGTEFEITRETALFSTAKKHIEAATSHYLKAGYRSSSEYATATNRLLDAYMYGYNAQMDTDPGKKAQFYQLAERLLQDSAGLYLKAKHPEKSDEVRTILENIKREKQIAITLAELMHAPTFVSNTSSFSTPTPTHEQAVGLERFELADIQANLILRDREVKIGEDIDLEIELVNAGKAPAQLIKVEEIIPEGFNVSSAPDICRVEDSYLDMKGRTLSPLKTVELKLALKPVSKGTFQLKPRILYLDESGKYKHHEPEPATVTVKELGISGWLRGPTR